MMERASRFFCIVVEVRDEESNIKLMESVSRLAETLQLPDGCQVRGSYEVSTDFAHVIINM